VLKSRQVDPEALCFIKRGEYLG